MLAEEYLSVVYCFIDGMMKECWKNIRNHGPGAKSSVADVITREFTGEPLGGLRQ